MKIGICGNFTTSFLVDELAKLVPTASISEGAFNQYNLEMRSPGGAFNDVDFLILCLDWRELTPQLFSFSIADDFSSFLSAFIDSCIAIEETIRAFRIFSSAKILIFSPISDWYSPLGFIDRLNKQGLQTLFGKCQLRFNDICLSSADVYPVDMEKIASFLGKKNAFDFRMQQLAKSPFSAELYTYIAHEINGLIQQTIKYPLKCIILDLDNTLWGGIIGEDGIQGIQLGELGIGKAFLSFQMELKRLFNQGVILAVCSKNNEADAYEVFNNHSDMILRLDMISAIRINWTEKPENILSISKELNIGLSSILFIDDSIVEREMVRSMLPEVEILELPTDPVYYSDTLRKCTRFSPLQITREDAVKSRFFIQEKTRKDALSQSNTVEDYLMQSRIKVIIRPVNEQMLPRIAQLFSKTNQFNLTTKRYSQTELQGFASIPSNKLLGLQMSDKYGEYGIIGASLAIGNVIDSFLLSCRAFGRHAEKALLFRTLDDLMARGFKEAYGLFIPSAKNSLVEDFYKNNNFDKVDIEGLVVRWRTSLTSTVVKLPAWLTFEEDTDDRR